MHSLKTACSFLFSADVYRPHSITERETLMTVSRILQYWSAHTNRCWTDWQLIQMWSAVITNIMRFSNSFWVQVLEKNKTKHLRRLKRGVHRLSCHFTTSHSRSCSAVLWRPFFQSFFEGNPVWTEGNRSERPFLKTSPLHDHCRVTAPNGTTGRSQLFFPHMRSDGIFERLWLVRHVSVWSRSGKFVGRTRACSSKNYSHWLKKWLQSGALELVVPSWGWILIPFSPN